MSNSLLTVDDLQVAFSLGRGAVVRAVDGVSFQIGHGETLGFVGESGCGKSTTGRAILKLVAASAGRVVFDGTDVLATPDGSRLRALRKRMQIVFQDPYGSLSPRLTVAQIVAEPLLIHGLIPDRKARAARVTALLDSVGLPADSAARYPHEFSGGQRQRIGIARALALDPEFIVLDEPVSALDISVRAQVVNLLIELQRERGIAYLFIGHDLSLIRRVADRIAVMYLGRIVETATAEDLYADPRHPYTRSLLDAIPIADPTRRKTRPPIQGDPPGAAAVPSGCRFRTRCPYAQPICTNVDPPFVEVPPGEAAHRSACHFALTLPVWQSSS